MDSQILLEVAHLVSLHSTLLIINTAAVVVGLGFLGWQVRAVSADLRAIATLTAEVLRRVPEQ